MRVAIVGPRDLHVSQADISYAIEQSGFKVTKVLTGDAKGIDACVRRYAKEYYPNDHKVFTAPWSTKGKGAGPYRNWFMINKGGAAEALIAIVRDNDQPCTSGTASSIAEAVIKGIPIQIVKV